MALASSQAVGILHRSLKETQTNAIIGRGDGRGDGRGARICKEGAGGRRAPGAARGTLPDPKAKAVLAVDANTHEPIEGEECADRAVVLGRRRDAACDVGVGAACLTLVSSESCHVGAKLGEAVLRPSVRKGAGSDQGRRAATDGV